jgi:hypothetical protein
MDPDLPIRKEKMDPDPPVRKPPGGRLIQEPFGKLETTEMLRLDLEI